MTNTTASEDEQEALERGEAAALLLGNSLFLDAIEALRTDCAETILRSSPEQRERREDAYQLSRALTRVTEELVAIRSLGEQVAMKMEGENEPSDNDADHLRDQY